ncbi:hypothetical protein N7461_004588 [Penicillium sp. DV-2018c]|nr:hypothetical protein N7461_004588 [Penicillium sp. DV-2018c]
MHLYNTLAFLLTHLSLSQAAVCSPGGGGCGNFPACVLTDRCATATFTSPSTTTITSCVPTPTCMGHPVTSVIRPNNAARDTVLLASVDLRMRSGRLVVRIVGLVLLMNIVVMGMFVLGGFVGGGS